MRSRRGFLKRLVTAGSVFSSSGIWRLRNSNPFPGILRTPGTSSSSLEPGKLYRSPNIHFGVCYYPEQWEQWDPSRLEADVKLMREAGFNIVRMAEHAWARIESTEGHYDFAWLDQVVDTMARNGIYTVLGTPTTQPPAWLFEKHPNLFSVTVQGIRHGLGSRYVYCLNHSALGKYVRKIVAAMAERYGTHPYVLGWQIDNETGWDARQCWCKEYCEPAFRAWLRERYGTLDQLNQAWGTAFWGMTYARWSQIPLPRPSVDGLNPGHVLDQKRFWSDSVIRFLKFQIDMLSKAAPSQFVLHNTIGTVDHFKLAEQLNVVGLMSYPSFMATDCYQNGLMMDTYRGYKGGNYWVVEQQGGMPPSSLTPSWPEAIGLLRLWAYQSFAHGADAVIFFRHRTASHGAEQYWQGILGHDGRPNRRFRELADMGKELDRIGTRLAGSEVVAPVAFYIDNESEWAKRIPDITPFSDKLEAYYAAFKRLGINIAVSGRGFDLGRYHIVVAPMLYKVNEDMVSQFRMFVEAGGTLVLTFRSGVKEWNNSITTQPLPGRLRELAGVVINEYEPLLKNDPALTGGVIPVEGIAEPFVGRKSTGSIWADILNPQQAKVLARYGGKHYSGSAAVTANTVGKGTVVYVGTRLARDFCDSLARWCAERHGISPPFPVPDNVDLSWRQSSRGKILFVMNFNNIPQTVRLPRSYFDLLRESELGGEISIPARDLSILSEK